MVGVAVPELPGYEDEPGTGGHVTGERGSSLAGRSPVTARQQPIPLIFGRRLQREREARHWSMRGAAERCGLSASTIMRAERGEDMALSGALALAALYGVSMDALLAESACARCDGMPPAGFICGECGRGAS
jgi:ribosome-binding protein aMBF1 (putative translation factor)